MPQFTVIRSETIQKAEKPRRLSAGASKLPAVQLAGPDPKQETAFRLAEQFRLIWKDHQSLFQLANTHIAKTYT